MIRRLFSVTPAEPTTDGAGVRLYRALGTRAVEMVDPFLMLDEFRSDQPGDYLKGFPDHPHRGFETVTYMLAGTMRHEDSVGHAGQLRAGGVQWMTAGRGVIHSEMPAQEDGLLWGFQLWVNLPARLKFTHARYQNIAPEQIPRVQDTQARIHLIAGTLGGVQGPITGIETNVEMLDVTLPGCGAWSRTIPSTRQGFVYVFKGALAVGSKREGMRKIPTRHLGVLGPGDSLQARAGDNGARFLLLTGLPCNEPVARYGPFVMNTETEIRQAIRDYQAGTLTD